ncbi:MAG: chromate efflux transporter [Anaerolineae bacterium]|jgi:chromate transporter|nr:chromate efflux transporter [Actinomycetota bacterium]MCG2785537.1 chromate efflux transporter [Anaerolineae bacterium]
MKMNNLLEVILLFGKLGFTAFGGPAAHIAMYHDEVVRRRKWIDEQRFLDLLGATQLIPGPNSTEMVMHIGYLRAGWPGLILGGLAFIIPATLIVTVFAWAYVEFGSLPQIGAILYGVKPVIIAIIAQALWDLGRRALKTRLLAGCGLAALGLYFAGINEIALLFLAGLAVMLLQNYRQMRAAPQALLPLSGLGLPALLAQPFGLATLFWTFFKIGSVLYGSGYVLLAFMHTDFVLRLGWLTDQQLLDAIAVGQVTPGPLFTSATFIGYILGGLPGALIATLGIFAPAYIFVIISNPFIPKLRNSPWAASLLDGVNAASMGLMAAVTLTLTAGSLTDWFTIFLAVAALVMLIRFKINSTWLVLAGAVLGWLAEQFVRLAI